MRTEDGNIVHQCLNGEPGAFGMLVDKYKEGIYAFAYDKLQDFQDAQDVTQEVFLQAYRGLRTLRRWESLAFWLYRIAYARCTDLLRVRSKRADRDFIEDQDPQVIDAPSLDSYRRDQQDESLRGALDSLPDAYREVLVLHYFGGMTIKDMANALGVSPGAIGMRLSRARAQLREEMIAMMDTTFESQRLPTGFTFRIVEAVKRIKIDPMPRMGGLPWGLSLAAGVIVAVLSLGPHVSITSDISIPSGSPLPVESKVLKTGEITVDIMDVSQMSLIASKQGDSDGGEPLSQNDMLLAPPVQVGTWTERAEMSTAKLNPCSAVVDGKIYVIGGQNEQKDGISILEEYDPAANVWVRKADMMKGRGIASANTVDGKIYVIGGYDSRDGIGVPNSRVEEYDLKTDTWRWRADMPTARYFFGADVVDGKIYAIGGLPRPFGQVPPLSAVEEYDPGTDTWVKKKNMPTPRAMMSAAAVDGKIYVIGGYLENQIATQLVEEYDPKTDSWTRKADMPTARTVFSTSVVNGKVYAIGGILRGGVPYATVEVYDPVTDTWETRPSMPTGRAHHSSSAVNGKIYVMGGTTVFAPPVELIPTLATVLQYDIGFVDVDPTGKLPTTWGETKSH
jgi:RNA polymerase sigma factor (sigma-70 family)